MKTKNEEDPLKVNIFVLLAGLGILYFAYKNNELDLFLPIMIILMLPIIWQTITLIHDNKIKTKKVKL